MLARHVDQLALGGRDRRVGRLARHGGLREELEPEILHREPVEVPHYLLGPFTGSVLALTDGLLVSLRRLPLRCSVALRGRLPAPGHTAGHHPLIARQPVGCFLPVSGVGEVVGVARCRGEVPHAPVDTDRLAGSGERQRFGADDEGGVPVPEAVPVDAHAGGIRRQSSRPHHRQSDAARQVQPSVLQTEAASGVVERRVRPVLLFEPGHARPSPQWQPRLDVLQRFGPGSGEIPDSLLLRHTPTCAQPLMPGAPAGQHPVESGRPAFLSGSVRRTGCGDALVPHPAAAVRFIEQSRQRGGRDAQPEGEPGVPRLANPRRRGHGANLERCPACSPGTSTLHPNE
ncbi:hypothetical protein SLAV_23140 [Streptomyces lavendulae subsp. lavendulae]|uniref:Uncharacterized protein n=1 Tax=Streptomyces lavendulae subsp. lavendulae TaxID=58340 RepID=A0A2K8PIX8_STRLA|nr:hypothetical protein SLAV_23140 [Streptomyces lavendulae subsp. lavendulae]QUQ56266.1 hypothetical protein SLLC_21260 [Streptomyces lavendulae subsp. lavendulae]